MDLIKHYITQSNTIIMGILPARCDIEVDSALELIKSIDSIKLISEPTWTRSNFICGVKSLKVRVN